MIIRPLLRVLTILLLFAAPAWAQADDKTERLGVPGPISFEARTMPSSGPRIRPPTTTSRNISRPDSRSKATPTCSSWRR